MPIMKTNDKMSKRVRYFWGHGNTNSQDTTRSNIKWHIISCVVIIPSKEDRDTTYTDTQASQKQ